MHHISLHPRWVVTVCECMHTVAGLLMIACGRIHGCMCHLCFALLDAAWVYMCVGLLCLLRGFR